jgi:serine/threonine-protein phosphatase 2A regulatory subunit B'
MNLPHQTTQYLEFYHEQLCFILIQYTNKDPGLCISTIRSVLRFWPSTRSNKQILFLNEIEELVEVLQPDYLPDIQDALLRRLCACIESSHFQVAERALALWNNEILCAVMLENRAVREMSYPMLFTSLLRTWKNSWNKGVQQLAEGLLGFLQALDYDMYHRCEAMRVAR